MEESRNRPVVMFLAPKLEIGGAEAMLDLALSQPDELKFYPIVCCTYSLGAVGQRLKERGIKVYYSLANGKWDIKALKWLLNIIEQDDVAIIYNVVSGNNTLFYGLLAAKLSGKAFVNAIHNARTHSVLVMLWQRVCMKFADRVIALSSRHREFIAQYYRVDSRKIHIVPNGVILERFVFDAKSAGEYREKLNVLQGVPLVVIIATLRPLKAHDVFLRAAQKVLSRYPNAQFLVVGDGSERKKLEQYAGELDVGASVRFLGQRTDIPEILSCVDISVLSSRQETFPMSILESMAASKPVIVTNVGFLDELVQDGEAGFLVNPDDADGLADAIVNLIGNPDLARRMGIAGRKHVDETFSLQKTITAIQSLVFEFLNDIP